MKVRFIYTKQVEVEKEVSDDFIPLLDEDTMYSRSWLDLNEAFRDQAWEIWAQLEKEPNFYRPLAVMTEDDDILAEY